MPRKAPRTVRLPNRRPVEAVSRALAERRSPLRQSNDAAGEPAPEMILRRRHLGFSLQSVLASGGSAARRKPVDVLPIHAGGVVQALLDSNAFRVQTPGSLFRPRKTVNQIDPLIDAYHGAPQAGKLAALDALFDEVQRYIQGKPANPADDRLTAVRNLRNDILAERPRAQRVTDLAAHGVTATIDTVGLVESLGGLGLNALAALAQVNTVQQIATLNNLPRANPEILQLAAHLPQANTYGRLRALAASPRPTAEILALADLAGAGLGGVTVPAPPTYGELLALVTGGTSLAQYTVLMATGAVHTANQLDELARTGRIQAALDGLTPSGAEGAMYFIPMNLHYGDPENSRTRASWGAAYGSVFAIGMAADRLGDAARSDTIRNYLIGHGTLRGGTAQVPGFLVEELRGRWLATHTGAAGVHYQGGDTGGDQRAT